MEIAKIREIIAKMTLEEKAGLCSGDDFWHTKAVERLGIPRTMVSDGPHGLRKQNESADHLGVNESIKAVCFPAGCATAASFNRELMYNMGATLGNECQAEGISVILGPAMNIKRSPICGRNFEYYSEDPYVSSEIAAAFINGVQSKGIGTSPKHFLANNQETRRMTASSNIDERTLREIYLSSFEGAVKKAKPWTVMSSYNLINGKHATESREYLSDILRDEWGFDGYAVSDWGAVFNRVLELEAGLELEMPSSNGENDKKIVAAVRDGSLNESILDRAVERILNIVFRYEENKDADAVWNPEEDLKASKKVAEETIVLLKNDNNILPLDSSKKIAFVGKYAKKPRYQGGGSSHINSYKVINAYEYSQQYASVDFALGFDDAEDVTDEKLLREAVNLAEQSDVCVVFAGLPDAFESEGFDRKHMSIPDCQNELIEKICEVQKNVVIVLHNGSPVEMPWINKVSGIVEAYLSGDGCGAAVSDILFGKVNPSAKLPESFPIKLEDNSSYLSYLGEGNEVSYTEGIFVGYRYYDKKKMEVLFPFGYGLSYTDYEYSNLKVSSKSIKDTDELIVSVDVTNTGKMAGKEIVELYVSDCISKVIRPVNELRGFEKIELAPQETKTVEFRLDKRAFAYFNTTLKDWHVESGDFLIRIGKSSRNIVCEEKVYVESTVRVPVTYTLDTPVCDIMEDDKAYELAKPYIMLDTLSSGSDGEATSEAISKEMIAKMIEYMPIRGMLSFSDGKVTMEDLTELVTKLNQLN